MLPVRKNGTYEAEITDLNAEGEGIGAGWRALPCSCPGRCPGSGSGCYA